MVNDAVVLDPRNPGFVTIPNYSAVAAEVDVQRRIRLVDLSDAEIQETISLTGVYAAYLRQYLLQMPPASRRTVCQNQMGLADVELSDFQVESVEEPDVPLRLRLAYTLKKQFHRSDDRLAGMLRTDIERSYLAAGPVDKRLTPFEITIPVLFRSKISVNVPEGFQAESSVRSAPQLDSRFVVCNSQLNVEHDQLNLQFECRTPGGKFEPGDYAAYREAMGQALGQIQREIIFKRMAVGK